LNADNPSWLTGRDPASMLRSGAGQWRIMALLMLGVGVCHFNRISISVAGAEKIIPNYGIDPTVMGVIYSAYLLCYTICMTPGGWFIDRFGPRIALMVLAFGSAVFVSLTGWTGLIVTVPAQLVIALLVARGLLGVVSAPIHPGSSRMVSHWFPLTAQSTCNGLVTAAACVGMASTYTVFGFLMDRLDWPGAFLVCGGATLVLALVWTALACDYPSGASAGAIVPPESEKPTGIQLPPPADIQRAPGLKVRPPIVSVPPRPVVLSPREQFIALLGNRSLILLTLSYAALGYFQYLFFYWAQYYFEDVLKLGKETSRVYATIPLLAMGVGMFVGGWLADRALTRLGPRRGPAVVPVVGLLASAVVLALGLLSGEPTVTLVCFSVSMACAGASEGPFWTTSIVLGGRLGGTGAAILNTGGNAGGLLAPVITPLFSKFVGWQAGISVACFVCVAGAVLWWWIDPTEQNPSRDAP
jgi:MFS family permease